MNDNNEMVIVNTNHISNNNNNNNNNGGNFDITSSHRYGRLCHNIARRDVIIAVIFVLILAIFNLKFFYSVSDSPSSSSISSSASASNSRSQNSLSSAISKEQWRSLRLDEVNEKFVLLFPEIAKYANTRMRQSIWQLDSEDTTYWKSCWDDYDFFRMNMDPVCTFLWMEQLQHSKVTLALSSLAVVTRTEEKKGGHVDKPMQSGGMHVQFDVPYKTEGYWKPCVDEETENGESWWRELIAFYIDRLGGFYHTPAVVSRGFTRQELNKISAISRDEDSSIGETLETVVRHCSDPSKQLADGAMVGWLNFPIYHVKIAGAGKDNVHSNAHFVRFGALTRSEVSTLSKKMNVTIESTDREKRWALENVSIHMFSILIGTLSKFGHNLFKLQSRDESQLGPYTYFDNDRGNWRKPSHKRIPEVTPNNSLFEFCKFPRHSAQRLLVLKRRSRDQRVTMGSLIRSITRELPSPYKKREGDFFTAQEAGVLDRNVQFLADGIEGCIARYGIDAVLIPEPWINNATLASVYQLESILKKRR